MLDQALEEACADPENLGLAKKSWRVEEDLTSPKSDFSGSPRNLDPRPRYLKTDADGVAPANKKRFLVDKIQINSGKEVDFESGLNLNP